MEFVRVIDIAITDELILENVRLKVDIPKEQIGLISQHVNEYGATLKNYTSIEYNGLSHIVEGTYKSVILQVRENNTKKI